MEVNTIISKVEEEEYETCSDDGIIKLDDEEKNIVLETPCPKDVVIDEEEEGTELTTPRTKIGYNVQATHLKKLSLLSMFDTYIDNTIDN